MSTYKVPNLRLEFEALICMFCFFSLSLQNGRLQYYFGILVNNVILKKKEKVCFRFNINSSRQDANHTGPRPVRITIVQVCATCSVHLRIIIRMLAPVTSTHF